MKASDLIEFLEIPSGDAFDVSADRAIAYFRAKGLRASYSYADTLGAANDRAFTIAKMMDVDLLRHVRDSLDSALANGTSFREWSRELEPVLQKAGWWGVKPTFDPTTGQTVEAQLGAPWRLETIFRTNMQAAYASGQWQEIQAQAEAAPFLLYDAVDDFRTRPLHRAWDNTCLPVSSAWWNTHFPPNGWNCFPAEQQVSGSFDVGLKAWYSGPMVELSTGKGRRLTCTANHPVLTPRGWVAAGMLREGDSLVAYSGEIESTILRGVQHEQGPTRCEDAFEALREKGIAFARVESASPLDLYGDAKFGDGHIDVVGIDRVLRGGVEAGQSQGIKDGALAVTDALREPLEAGAGGLHALCDAALPSSAGGPGLRALPFNVGPVGAGPLDPLLLAASADLDSGSDKEGAHGVAADSALLRKAEDAFARLIELDDLVAVRRYEWSGHVFDFQSETGFILAGGIVTSNCRCGVIQLDAEELQSLGISTEQDPPADGTYKWTNPRTGQVSRIPNGIDPGWNRNSGRGYSADLQQQLLDKVQQLPPDMQAAVEGTLRKSFDTKTEAGRWHAESFDYSAPWVRDAVLSSPSVEVEYGSQGAYASMGRLINMGSRADKAAEANRSVWRHEYGHILDWRLQGEQGLYRSSFPDFHKAQTDDAIDLIEASGKGRKSKRQQAQADKLAAEYKGVNDAMIDAGRGQRRQVLEGLAEAAGVELGQFLELARRSTLILEEGAELESVGTAARLGRMLKAIELRDGEGFLRFASFKDDPEQWKATGKTWRKDGALSSLSDLIGSATRNKVASYDDGFPGHSDRYYSSHTTMQGTESFANLMSLSGHELRQWWELVRRFTPRMADLFEQILLDKGKP